MAEAAAATSAPAANVKPTKPDQDVFNKDLAKAQKEHDDVMAKYVSASYLHPIGLLHALCTFPYHKHPTSSFSH